MNEITEFTSNLGISASWVSMGTEGLVVFDDLSTKLTFS